MGRGQRLLEKVDFVVERVAASDRFGRGWWAELGDGSTETSLHTTNDDGRHVPELLEVPQLVEEPLRAIEVVAGQPIFENGSRGLRESCQQFVGREIALRPLANRFGGSVRLECFLEV